MELKAGSSLACNHEAYWPSQTIALLPETFLMVCSTQTLSFMMVSSTQLCILEPAARSTMLLSLSVQRINKQLGFPQPLPPTRCSLYLLRSEPGWTASEKQRGPGLPVTASSPPVLMTPALTSESRHRLSGPRKTGTASPCIKDQDWELAQRGQCSTTGTARGPPCCPASRGNFYSATPPSFGKSISFSCVEPSMCFPWD